MIHMAMVKDQMFGKTMRKSYAKYEEILEMPNMLKIQKDSYQWFLEEGLQGIKNTRKNSRQKLEK